VQACSNAYLSLSPWTSAYSRAAAGKLGDGTKAAASTLSCVDTRKHCTHRPHHGFEHPLQHTMRATNHEEPSFRSS
jgi:hypothetical protein